MLDESLFDLTISGPVICVACSEDGNKIVVGDRNGNLTLLDKNGQIIWEKNIDEGVHGLAMVGNGNKVICGGKDCKLRMFSSMGNVEWEQTIGKSIWSLAADPNGQFIAIGTGDSIILFTEGGLQMWEYPTNRAMVGTGISRNGDTIVGCGDEYLYCLDSEGQLKWERKRSDSLWDVTVDKNGENIFVGGWDEKVHCLNKSGEDVWDFKTGGYVRTVEPLENGGVIAGSHDGSIYRLSSSGDILGKINTNGEITSASVSKLEDFAAVGLSNRICGFEIDSNSKPIAQYVEPNPLEPQTQKEEKIEEEYEPMFGVGMFDEPIPDTTGILNREESVTEEKRYDTYGNTSPTSTNYYDENIKENIGGEFRKFASEIVKGDVKNYLRLGNLAWSEKRYERAAEHYKRATEIDPEEPRAWHNLAICNYHLALKRNPENIKGAVQCAYTELEMAKKKGGTEYTAPDKTLEYLASQLGLETE